MNDLGIINPCCGFNKSKVYISVPKKDGIERYRECLNPTCKGGRDRNPGRFATFEKFARMLN